MSSNKRQRVDKKQVYIVGMARTPMGCLLGNLSSMTAPQLGGVVIKQALERSNLQSTLVEEVFMGNVVSAGLGQAPARQAALNAGLSDNVPCTTINKVCASGMKAITLAAQAILCGQRDIVIAGGMESMSNIPHYAELRKGKKFGNISVIDGMQQDGLQDAYDKVPMGNFAELCATNHNISREAQDEYAAKSYQRARDATTSGKFKDEICGIERQAKDKSQTLIDQDEEPMLREITKDSLASLRTVFQSSNGTVTAGNASPISDGAAALVLVSKEKALELNLSCLFELRGFDDAAQEPKLFTTSPSLAIPKALSKANLRPDEVDYYEINEAFAVVALANMKILGLNHDHVNVYGGAVAMGHPLGCSGARIVVTLCSVLRQEKGKIGVAAVCNGSGGASALCLERLV